MDDAVKTKIDYEISQIDELIVSWAFRFLAENKKLNRKIFSNVILFDTFVCHTNSHIAFAVISINFHTETARSADLFMHGICVL